jgi:aminomethyltransferase
MDDSLRTTPLHAAHVALGGKMVPFAGFSMPVQYPAGITAEHRAVREAAGLFDVSHMGEFDLSGPDADAFLQYVTVNDVSRVAVGQAQYSALCREDGCVLDDLLVYRQADRWMVVVNASNREQDLAWMQKHAADFDVELVDRSDETALLALQGPRAQEVLAPLAPGVDLDSLGYYRFTVGEVAGISMLVARTGYTGEDGFELYVPAGDAHRLWDALLEVGAPLGLIPAGLGARDSLRLEMGYALYGNDLDLEHTALESGLGWIVKLDKGPFVGRDALAEQKAAGVPRRLVGLRCGERVFPRAGYPVFHGDEQVGVVTSGVASPTLGIGVALAWVPSELAAPGTTLDVRIRDRPAPAVVERPPFHKGGSVRR